MLQALKPLYTSYSGGKYEETKGGSQLYGGHPQDYFDWRFRVEMKLGACADEDPKKQRANEIRLTAQILDGLRDAAFQIAQEIGQKELQEVGGIPKLLQKLHDHIFPNKDALFKMMHEVFHNREKNMLRRRPAEAMYNYINRHKKWYHDIQEIAPAYNIPDRIRADA